MRYYSAQDKSLSIDFVGSVLSGRAADGGLYMPDIENHKSISWTPDFAEFAARMLLVFAGDSLGKAEALSLVRRALTFAIHWREFSKRRYQLELFHGPTGASKDFGAQLLAQLLAAIPCVKQRLVIVASNTESGPAIAAAFSKQPSIHVIILYPKKDVTEEYPHRLNCWGNNIKTLAVDGSLQCCREMIFACEKEKAIQDAFTVTCVDDANIVWLLAQITCCAYSSLLADTLHRQPLNLIIPTGNAGYLTAACITRQMGYPINEIVAAQNSNNPIEEFVSTGYMSKREKVATLIPVMDVTQPANWSRLLSLYPSWDDFIDDVQAFSVTDEEIKTAIRDCYEHNRLILSPQSAVAYNGLPSLSDDSRAWAITAVSHPSKSAQLLQSLIGKNYLKPEAFMGQQRFMEVLEIPADASHLTHAILGLCEQLEIAC